MDRQGVAVALALALAATWPVLGQVNDASGRPTLACTQSGTWTMTGTGGVFPVTGTFWPVTQPISGTVTCNAGTGTLTVTGAGGTFPVTGTFWQATQPVSGTFWQATQPVSGAVAATATQSGTWTVQPGNTQNTTAWLTQDATSGSTGSAVPARSTYTGGSNGTNLTGNTTASAATLTAATAAGAQLGEKGPRWSVVSTPAVSNKASASKSAGAAGVRHVADCVTYSGGASTAPAATALTVELRDGATGAGTIVAQWRYVAPAVTGTHASMSVCGLNLVGSAATAMTLEFSALLTNEFQSVTVTGYDVN